MPEEIKDEGSLIEQAKNLHKQIQAENDRREGLLKREEQLHAEQMLGGRASAGQQPEPPKELTPKEYAAKVMAGEIPK